jgi:hypothetical protein
MNRFKSGFLPAVRAFKNFRSRIKVGRVILNAPSDILCAEAAG